MFVLIRHEPLNDTDIKINGPRVKVRSESDVLEMGIREEQFLSIVAVESWVGGVEIEMGEGVKEDEEEEEEEEGQSWSEQSQPPSQKYHLVTQAPLLTSWQLLPSWLQHSAAHPITLTFLSAKMHGILLFLMLPVRLH